MVLEFVRKLPYDHPYRWDGTLFGGPKLWRPDELGGSLALWLDAEDTSTITLNGSNVSQWDDKSGNNRHVTQATASNQPTYTTAGLNGKSIITFDGTGDGLTLASEVSIPRDMVSVSKGHGYLYSGNISDQRILYTSSGNVLYWDTAIGSPNNLTVTGRNATDTFIEQYTAENLDWEIYLNGSSAANGSVSSAWVADNEMNQIGLKWNPATGVSTWTGYFAEIVWTGSVMSTADRQKLEGYLAHKWGLEADLPSGHPYKSTPPTV